jgi:uncharacterized protein DUF5658
MRLLSSGLEPLLKSVRCLTLPGVLAGLFVAFVAAQPRAEAQDVAALDADAAQIPVLTPHALAPERPSRPAPLPALYVGQCVLQAMDVHSTFEAVSLGAHEANPVMKGIAGNKGAMVAVKAAVAASTILMSEHLWKRGNRKAAIVSMIVVNSVTAMVVAHNYRVSGGLQQ